MTSTTMTYPVPTSGAHSRAASFPGIPFGRLVRVEWSKATDTRAARWLLIAVAATTVGLMLTPILSPSSIDQSYTSYLGFAAIALSILLPVVSILTLTSEWSQRTALTTFTQEPRRLRVVTAKITVSLMLG
ncbi:MAG: type transport system permease protein, partial [Actinomycetota bacterium]|nr:type transport system permease protein [Actinomycetota bacterium]